MTRWRHLKITTILAFVLLAIGIFLSWYTADLFPWLHIVVFLSVSAVVVVNYSFEQSILQFYWSVAVVIVAGVTLRAPMVLFPGSLSGNDPEKYALFAQLTLESGSYRLPTVSFYGIAGGFHTYIAQTAAIAGVPTETAMVIFALLVGVLGPCLAVSYCFVVIGKTHHGYTAGIIAGTIAAVAALSVRTTYIPFAQTMGTVLLLTFILSVLRHIRLEPADKKLNWVILTVLLLGMAFSHKLPVLIASVLLFGGWIATKITNVDKVWPGQLSRSHIPFALVLMATLIAVIQQTIVTSYVSRALDHTESTAGSSLQAPQRVGEHPEAATTVDVGLLFPFQGHSHTPVTLAVAGLLWVVVMWYIIVRPSRDDIAVPVVFLVSIASLTSFVLITIGGGGVGSAAPNPMRFQVLQEPLLAALIGIGYVTTRYSVLSSELSRSRFKRIFFGILLLILMFHAFSVVAAPDYPGETRDYLTEGEIAGKDFADDHIETSIATDNRLQRQTANRGEVTDKRSPWIQLGARPDTKFTAHDHEFLQGTVTESGFETLLHRPNVQTYSASLFKDYRYQITWDVEHSADQTYHRMYDNGHAITHRDIS